MRRNAVAVFVILLLAGGAAAWALPAGEVILAWDTSMGGGPVALSATDGSGLQATCAGDLSHEGSRRFLRTEDHRLMVTPTTCGEGATLLDVPHLFLRAARWSVNGSRVAFWAQSSAMVAESLQDPPLHDAFEDPAAGVYVAEVVIDTTGWPTAVTNVRQVVPLPWSRWNDHPIVSWAGDDHRVAYTYGPKSRNDDGTIRYGSGELHIADLTTGQLVVHTDPSKVGGYPAFSTTIDPRVGEYAIAMTKQTVASGVVRTDIFVMFPDGSGLRQVTTKSNSPAATNNFPQWSPDGTKIGFSGMANKLGSTYHIMRVAADGKSKAADLTPKTNRNLVVQAWRR